MKVIGVVNQKGGVGKTTVALSLASVMAEAGEILVIDTDPQQSATWWAKQVGEEQLPFDFATSLDPAQLSQLRKIEAYEAVFIDTPGSLENTHVVSAVLDVADYVVLPTDPAPLAVPPLLNTISTLLAPRGIPYRVLINRVDSRTSPVEVPDLQTLLDLENVPYFSTYVRTYKTHERAALNSQVATLYGLDRSSRNALEDIRKVALELAVDWKRSVEPSASVEVAG